MIPGTDAYDIAIEISDADIERLLSVMPEDVEAASALSYCRNVFLPLTTACRYTCTYCTYYDPPGQAELMDREALRAPAAAGPTPSVRGAVSIGDDPDDRYTAVHDQLAEWGHDSIHEYLREPAKSRGGAVLCHQPRRPGTRSGPRRRPERLDGRDAGDDRRGAAHSGSRRKTPGQRLNTIRAAGEVGVPFTTGILVGIGETWRDRAESLLAIRALHERYGHVQEVIVQNVVPNERWQGGSPDLATMRRVTAMARAALPEEVSVQVPPNLAPARDLSPAASTTSAASRRSRTTTSTPSTSGPRCRN